MTIRTHVLKVGDDLSAWDHRFTWTSEHPTIPEVRRLLYTSDDLATKALDRLDEISPSKSNAWKCPHGSSSEGEKGEGVHRDLYKLLELHADSDAVLGQLWREVNTVPDWVDWDQIERAQKIVYQYNGQILLGLLFSSLLGGMGASRVVETLARTGGFGVKVTRRRLLETLQHFLDVNEGIDSVQPGGKGFVSTVRVRLLHAAVRRRLTQLERQRPGYFDVSRFGVPINDLHAIATVCVYSTAVVYLVLPRQGIHLSQGQIADYLALWRWVGYLLGAPVDWMATPSQAKAMMESVAVSEINPSEKSRVLASNILTAESYVPPLYASREYLAAHAYRLNGDKLSLALGIERPSFRMRFLVWSQCMMLMWLSWTYNWLPASRRKRRDQRFKDICRTMITSKRLGGTGEPTKFEFQYVPAFNKMTELGPLKAVVTRAKRTSTMTISALIGAAILVSSIAILCNFFPQEMWSTPSRRLMATLAAQERALSSLEWGALESGFTYIGFS